MRKPGESESYERSWTRRRQAIEILGGECRGCGFDDPRALQITPAGTGASFNNHVIRAPEGYELFCANCNQIKRAGDVPKRWEEKVKAWKTMRDLGIHQFESSVDRSGTRVAKSLVGAAGDLHEKSGSTSERKPAHK